MILIVFRGASFARVAFAKVVFTRVVLVHVVFAARRARHVLVQCCVARVHCYVVGIVACGRMTQAVG